MRRALAVLALSILPAFGLAQDTMDSDSADTAYDEGAAGAAGDEGGRPTCACSGVGTLSVAPALAAVALVAGRRRYWMSRSTSSRSTPH